jgi:hypothetical protein
MTEMYKSGSRTGNTALRRVLLAMLLCLSQSMVMAAVQVKELYDVEVDVRDQGMAERQRAMQQGFAEMITRLSGSGGMQQLGQSATVLKRAARYVEQYRYRKSEESAAQQDPGLKLWMRFNRKAMQKLLQEQQLPLWGSTRPETLLWIAIENNRGRSILSSDRRNSLQRNVMGHASRRAIPLLLPLLDIEDRGKVRIGDIWGGFTTSIKLASARYEADNILIGKVYPAAGGWRSQWTLVSGAGEKSWSGSGSYAGQAIAAGIDGLADLLASRYAVKGEGVTATYRVAISQVYSLRDYDRVSQYLRRISLISGFRLHSITQGRVIYQIDLRGDVDDLVRALKLERQLLPDDASRPLTPDAAVMTNVIRPGETVFDQKPVPVTLYYRLGS